jgi:hypothetical protein
LSTDCSHAPTIPASATQFTPSADVRLNAGWQDMTMRVGQTAHWGSFATVDVAVGGGSRLCPASGRRSLFGRSDLAQAVEKAGRGGALARPGAGAFHN